MNASLSIKENELQNKAEPLQEGYGGLCVCDKPKALTVSLRWVALVYQHILILPLLSLIVSQFDFLCKCVCGMARSGWWTTAQDVPAWHPHEGIQRLHEGSQNTWCSSGGHFVSVCVLYAMTCHGNMMLSAGCSQTVERFITPDVWVPMCPAFGCMFACVRDGASQGYHPRSTGIREEEAPLVSETNTNFQ